MSKNTILASLKWVFAAAILFLLIKSGKLSFSDIEVFLSHPSAAVACVAIVATVLLLAFYRWRYLLLSQGIPVSYGTALRLGMLGQFFSAIIPGTVGGDLVKAVYVARRFPEQKIKTVTTIFLDRFIGLFAILVLGGVAFLLGRTQLATVATDSSRIVETLGWLLAIAAICILGGLALFPWLGRYLPAELPAFFKKLPAQDFFFTLYRVALAYKDRVRVIWFVLGLSIFMHLMNVGVLYVAARTVFGAAPWGAVTPAVFVVASVLGLCAIAIPIAPLGLGVGQVAFGAVFVAVGGPSAQFGITLITVSQIVNLTLNLTGSLFFATYQHEVQEAQV